MVTLLTLSPQLLSDVILSTHLTPLISPGDSGGCIQPTIALSNKSADLIVAATVRRITQQRAQSWAEVFGNAWWIFEVLI